MKDIETLNKLIVAAKEQNDDVLVDLYEKAINRILEQERNKEKPVEENIPEKIENIQQDKAIKKVAKGEVSTIVVYEDGKLGWESKYLDIPIKTKDASVITTLRRIAINLLTDDVTKESKTLGVVIDSINQYDDVNTLEQIDDFLVEASKIGKTGKETLEEYDAYKIDKNSFPYEDEYQSLLKDIAFAEKEDKENNINYVDENKYEETIQAYQRLIGRIQTFIDEAHSKLSREKISQLELKIMELNETIRTMRETLKQLKETNEITSSLDSI